MSAAAPTASTIPATTSTRPRRPYRALAALAVLVGAVVMAGAWVYLGPRAAPSEYFSVTFLPGAHAWIPPCLPSQATCDFPVGTRAEVVRQLGNTPYASITGPYPTFTKVDQTPDQEGDALRVGILAALIAFVAFGLLGVTARFRRFEASLGAGTVAVGRWFGATTRAKIGSLLLVAAGVIACTAVFIVLYLAFDALPTAQWWLSLSPYEPFPWVAIVALLSLLAVISMGALAVIAAVIRRSRISSHGGPFVIGYAGLLVGMWLFPLLGIGASCAGDPGWVFFGPAAPGVVLTPFACVAGYAGLLFAEDGWFPILPALWTLYCAIPVVGAVLVYRDYRRRRAAPSEPRLTRATA